MLHLSSKELRVAEELLLDQCYLHLSACLAETIFSCRIPKLAMAPVGFRATQMSCHREKLQGCHLILHMKTQLHQAMETFRSMNKKTPPVHIQWKNIDQWQPSMAVLCQKSQGFFLVFCWGFFLEGMWVDEGGRQGLFANEILSEAGRSGAWTEGACANWQ